jgi:hypothetical protein
MAVMTDLLPKRGRGRQTPAADAIYEKQLEDFCALMLKISSTMDFKVGSRGWCYILEQHGLRKGEFDAAQKLINDCRKSGALPLDICAEDASRVTIGWEKIDDDVEEEVENWLHTLRTAHREYTPFSFWDDRDVYVEVAVEKLDLRNLFEPVCAKFRVPITNFKGWSDIHSRAAMMRRFEQHEEAGRRCVLLVCGDHDPGGLHITDMLHKNLEDLENAVDWWPGNLIISRFGLNADFIEENNLSWIDNLETSSGGRLDDPRHGDHRKPYVQDYIKEFGVRKCEANALVVAPEAGRQLCRDAILQYVPFEAVTDHEVRLREAREEFRQALREAINIEE